MIIDQKQPVPPDEPRTSGGPPPYSIEPESGNSQDRDQPPPSHDFDDHDASKYDHKDRSEFVLQNQTSPLTTNAPDHHSGPESATGIAQHHHVAPPLPPRPQAHDDSGASVQSQTKDLSSSEHQAWLTDDVDHDHKFVSEPAPAAGYNSRNHDLPPLPPRPKPDDDSSVDHKHTRTASYQDESNEPLLPSVFFAIPYPTPVDGKVKQGSDSFLLYTFPRAVYKKPGEATTEGSVDNSVNDSSHSLDAAGNAKKPPKEKFIKKVERKWQEEVAEGEAIGRGDVKDASMWKRIKGGAARGASSVIKWMPNSTIEALARLPPGKKLGPVTVVYPSVPYGFLPSSYRSHAQPRTYGEGEVAQDLAVLLEKTRKNALRTQVASGIMLPVTFVADLFNPVPVFAFEINCAHFASQFNGARKATQLTKKKSGSATTTTLEEDAANDSPFSFSSLPPTSTSLAPVLELLYELCSQRAPKRFPTLPPGSKSSATATHALDRYDSASSTSDVSQYTNKKEEKPTAAEDAQLVGGMIREFKERLPKEVWERHVVDETRVAEDLRRCLRKAAKEFAGGTF